VRLDASCTAGSVNVLYVNVPVTSERRDLGSHGAKDLCGEDAPLTWKVTLENTSNAALSGSINIVCPRKSGLLPSPTAAGG